MGGWTPAPSPGARRPPFPTESEPRRHLYGSIAVGKPRRFRSELGSVWGRRFGSFRRLNGWEDARTLPWGAPIAISDWERPVPPPIRIDCRREAARFPERVRVGLGARIRVVSTARWVDGRPHPPLGRSDRHFRLGATRPATYTDRLPSGSRAGSGASFGRFGGEDSGCFDGSMAWWTRTPSTGAL